MSDITIPEEWISGVQAMPKAQQGEQIDKIIASMTASGVSKADAITALAERLGVKPTTLSVAHYRRNRADNGEPRRERISRERWAAFEQMIEELIEERVEARLAAVRKALG